MSEVSSNIIEYMMGPYTGYEQIGFVCLGLIIYLFATVLPDIDSNKSWVGRHVKFPGIHRGFTHALWVPAILFACWFVSPLVVWFALGYSVHLILDSMSACGIAWFYPLQRYHVYESGARIAWGHKYKLYASSGREAVLCCALITVIALSIGLFCLFV